jgi:hypothetical protein
MRPLGMQTSERPLQRLVRRHMPFGLLSFITINHDRQAPGQARLAKLSAERSAGTVFFFSFPPNDRDKARGQ